MKKSLFLLFVCVCIGCLGFIQLASAVVPAPVSPRTFIGEVESVSLGDSAKGTASIIVIVDEKGQKLTIEVKANTVIYDKTGNEITLDKIKNGDKVVIEYAETKETIEKAESIKLK